LILFWKAAASYPNSNIFQCALSYRRRAFDQPTRNRQFQYHLFQRINAGFGGEEGVELCLDPCPVDSEVGDVGASGQGGKQGFN